MENMFVGRPPGNYDRLLDYSRAVTGGLFFVPSADLLDALPDRNARGCGDSLACRRASARSEAERNTEYRLTQRNATT